MFSFTRSRSRCRLRIKKIPGAAIKQAGSETLRQLPHNVALLELGARGKTFSLKNTEDVGAGC